MTSWIPENLVVSPSPEPEPLVSQNELIQPDQLRNTHMDSHRLTPETLEEYERVYRLHLDAHRAALEREELIRREYEAQFRDYNRVLYPDAAEANAGVPGSVPEPTAVPEEEIFNWGITTGSGGVGGRVGYSYTTGTFVRPSYSSIRSMFEAEVKPVKKKRRKHLPDWF